MPRIEHTENGKPLFVHECTDGRERRTVLPLGADGWEWAADGSLTPSVHCTSCGTHGWWMGGDQPYWRPC